MLEFLKPRRSRVYSPKRRSLSALTADLNREPRLRDAGITSTTRSLPWVAATPLGCPW